MKILIETARKYSNLLTTLFFTGDCNGTAGNTTLRLYTPTTITMDKEERYLYVSDLSNHRIQRFILN